MGSGRGSCRSGEHTRSPCPFGCRQLGRHGGWQGGMLRPHCLTRLLCPGPAAQRGRCTGTAGASGKRTELGQGSSILDLVSRRDPLPPSSLLSRDRWPLGCPRPQSQPHLPWGLVLARGLLGGPARHGAAGAGAAHPCGLGCQRVPVATAVAATGPLTEAVAQNLVIKGRGQVIGFCKSNQVH